jgi:hypothetical protein
VDERDGTFFMLFEDWLRHFTHLFVGIQFPAPSRDPSEE